MRAGGQNGGADLRLNCDASVTRLPARVNKIGKIESRGKVLKLSDKLNLTRPFTAREKNRPVI